jgi:hypothetical protein
MGPAGLEKNQQEFEFGQKGEDGRNRDRQRGAALQRRRAQRRLFGILKRFVHGAKE